MRKYDAVIFDLDGTLLDSLEDLTDSVNAVLIRQDMPPRTREEVRSFVGNGMGKLIESAVPEGSKNPQKESIQKQFLDYYTVHCRDKTKPYEGVPAMLQELKAAGYALAIVSNKPDPVVKELAGLYFKDFIKVAIGERSGMERKPKPDAVFEALKELGVTGERAIYAGDSEVDIMTAANAGLRCICVLWGFREKAVLMEHGGELFVHAPEEIVELLLK